MKTQKKIIITGTHHTPAIETINQLQKDSKFSIKITYLGDLPPAELLDITFIHIPCGKYDRNSISKTLLSIPQIIFGFFKSILVISQIKPEIVVSFGGYVSVPVIIASRLLNISSITHEQTKTVSLATKINSYFVDKIALSFPDTLKKETLPANKIVVTGNILRQAIFNNHSPKFGHLTPTLLKKPLIYVTGGNQGSYFINSLVYRCLKKLNTFTIIHQTGKSNFPQFKSLNTSNYYPIDFVHQNDIGWVLNNAKIIISRAGANTCQELAVLGKNAILIPLPHAQQNEQNLNAQWLKEQNPNTIIFSQSQVTVQDLLHSILALSKANSPHQLSYSQANHPLIKLIYENI